MASRMFQIKIHDTNASLTAKEAQIIWFQIQKNSRIIYEYVERLDLIINREGHKRHEPFVSRIRERLYLLMEENDTFREVFWQYFRREEEKHASCPTCRAVLD